MTADEFRDGEPVGHLEMRSLEAAIFAALNSGSEALL
jgi:hypothetical protein